MQVNATRDFFEKCGKNAKPLLINSSSVLHMLLASSITSTAGLTLMAVRGTFRKGVQFMKLKVLGIVVGVLATIGIIGVGTIWAQGGTPTPAAPAAPSTNTSCDHFMH